MVPNQYLPSHLGEIPNDWKRVRFSDVMKVRQGLQIAISERLKEPTETSKEYITIQSINKLEQAREYVEAPSERVICTKEDVLMTRTGNTGIVVTDVDGVFHNNFFLMDFQRDLIDRHFLVNYLRTNRVQHLILTKAGASTIPDLNHKDFYSIEFPLAPLPEQRKIAKTLSTWDKAISATEKLIETSKQQKKALMQQLLTGKKRLVNPETGKAFDSEWENYTLSKVCKITKGKQLNRSTLKPIGKYPVINGGITPSGYTDSFNTKRNTITISEGGNSCGYIDFQKVDFWCGGHCYNLHEVTVDAEYLYQYLKFSERRIMSLRVGSGLPNIQKKAIESVPVLYPSKLEQQRIAAVLTAADKDIEVLEAKLAHFKQEKKALMQQLLTGKRRVKVGEEVAA